MSKRIPKKISMELIKFAKSIKVTANFWDPNAKSAFEIYRQLSGTNLKIANPSFEADLDIINDDKEPVMHAEFVDGSEIKMTTSNHDAMSLKALFFEQAENAETVMAKAKQKK